MSNQAVLPGIGYVSDPGNSNGDKPFQGDSGLPLGITPSQLKSKGWLFVVADGTGAPSSDPQGSRLAVHLIREDYYHAESQDITQCLQRAFTTANATIFNKSGGVLFNELSAAVVCAVVHSKTLHVAHAGDGRAYLVGPRRIQCLTTDHVVITETENAGDGAQSVTPKKLLTRAVGSMPTIEAEHNAFAVRADERILLCARGLTAVVNADEIQDCVSRHAPADAVQRLVDLARQHGGHENITAVVIDPSALDTADNHEPIKSAPIQLPRPVIAALVGSVALIVLALAWNFVSRGSAASVTAVVATATRQTTPPVVTPSPPPRVTETPVILALASATATVAPTATDMASPQPTDTSPAPTPVPTVVPAIQPSPTETPTPLPTPTPPPTPTATPRYTAVKSREPQDNQEVTGDTVTMEWEAVSLQPGDHYQVLVKRIVSENWERQCAPVNNDQCVLAFERAQGYGSYEWAVVVIDSTGVMVSPIKGTNRFNWSPPEKPKPCVPTPKDRC